MAATEQDTDGLCISVLWTAVLREKLEESVVDLMTSMHPHPQHKYQGAV